MASFSRSSAAVRVAASGLIKALRRVNLTVQAVIAEATARPQQLTGALVGHCHHLHRDDIDESSWHTWVAKLYWCFRTTARVRYSKLRLSCLTGSLIV